jgi:hypothetical protein
VATAAGAASTVLQVSPAPQLEPGDQVRILGVTYRVAEVLRGSVPQGELRVAHPVCLGRPWIDSLAVGLSTAHFQPGRRFVLFLRPDAERRVREGEWTSDYVVWDERFGALPESDELRAEIRKPAAASAGGGGDPFTRRRRRR